MKKTEYKKYKKVFKIYDGLFIGEHSSLYDNDFIESNKVTHIINSFYGSPIQENSQFDLKYLNINICENDNNIFGDDVYCLQEVFDFIQNSQKECTSVLIHSKNQYTIACSVLASYFILKFRWSIQKSWDFISLKVKNISKISKYFKNLYKIEKKVDLIDPYESLSIDWTLCISLEDQQMRNYYLNQTMFNNQQQNFEIAKKQKNKKITFQEPNTIQQQNQIQQMNIDLYCIKSCLKKQNFNFQTKISSFKNSISFLESTRSKDSNDIRKLYFEQDNQSDKSLQETNINKINQDQCVKKFNEHINNKPQQVQNSKFFDNFDHILKQNDYYIDLYNKYKINVKNEKNQSSQNSFQNFKSKDKSLQRNKSPLCQNKIPLQPINPNKQNQKYFSPNLKNSLQTRQESRNDISLTPNNYIKSPSLKQSQISLKQYNSQKVLFKNSNKGKENNQNITNKKSPLLLKSFFKQNFQDNINKKTVGKKLFNNVSPNKLFHNQNNSKDLSFKTRDESLRSFIYKD